MNKEKVSTISSMSMVTHCPMCGTSLSKETIKVSEFKTNIRKICEFHGVILLD